MNNDDSTRDPELDVAYAALPRTHATSPDFTDRVLRDLSANGLVDRPAPRVRWLAAAALIFAVGVTTGIGATMLIVAKRASGAAATVATVPLPDVGHAEVWY